MSRPYYDVWGGRGERALPYHPTTLRSTIEDLFSLRDGPYAMVRAARRTLRSRADLRWGTDRRGFRRLVHPMGVCLAGHWQIDSNPQGTSYTGYFASGTKGRVIARYSLGGDHAEGGHYRSLGLVGKVFPLADSPDGQTPRAHFITQEDLGGALTDSVTEVELTNAPPVTLRNRRGGLPAFIPGVVGLFIADAEVRERQLYEIAELEKAKNVPTSCPRFMRLQMISPRRGERDGIDFRDEILGMIYDAGDSRPKRTIEFAIEVSDAGRRRLFNRIVDQKWTRIGSLTFEEAAASFNGDFVVHFHHPAWRRDRNDPSSVQRRDLRRWFRLG